jgi:hypothetical protein
MKEEEEDEIVFLLPLGFGFRYGVLTLKSYEP